MKAHAVALDFEATAIDNHGDSYGVHGSRVRWRCACGDLGLYTESARSARTGGQRHIAAMERGK